MVIHNKKGSKTMNELSKVISGDKNAIIAFQKLQQYLGKIHGKLDTM